MTDQKSAEAEIRQEAKRLGIGNWHNKKIATLKQEVLEAKAAEKSGESSPKDTKESEQNAKEFEKTVKEQEELGNRGFIEAAKEESLYPYPNPKGDRIGLWRRVDHETFFKPYHPDSSFEFVRWADEN